MTDLLSELDEIPKWVKLVHDALVAADVTDANGEVRITPQELTQRMVALVGQEQFEALANSRQITVPLPEVGTVPQDSGFINDPVCTATGHLLVDARDFVMPARLDVLSFRRTYASQYLHDGAFGPGWWTWAECHGSIAADGTFEYVGPDGQELRLPAGRTGDSSVGPSSTSTSCGSTPRQCGSAGAAGRATPTKRGRSSTTDSSRSRARSSARRDSRGTAAATSRR